MTFKDERLFLIQNHDRQKQAKIEDGIPQETGADKVDWFHVLRGQAPFDDAKRNLSEKSQGDFAK